MEVRIKQGEEMIDATIEMVDGVMVVSPISKFEPKNGDVCRSPSCLYIFKTTKPSAYKINANVIVYHCCYNVEHGGIRIGEDVGVGHIGKYQRVATEEEKKLLFDKLSEEGLEWKVDTKELVKLKWKPKVGEDFYYPFFKGFKFVVRCFSYSREESINEDEEIQSGKVFKTKKECQEFCNRLNEAISQVKP